MKNKITEPLLILALIMIVIGSMAWYVWQYNLCYPEVSLNIWYCLQHAAP